MVNTQGGLSDLRWLRNGREGGGNNNMDTRSGVHTSMLFQCALTHTHTHTHRAKKQQARTAPRDKTTGATRAFSLTCGGCPGARQRQGSGPGGEGRQAANGQGREQGHTQPCKAKG